MWNDDRYFERMIGAGGNCEMLANVLLGEAVRPANMQYFNKLKGVGYSRPRRIKTASTVLQPRAEPRGHDVARSRTSNWTKRAT
jgi:hypothetical protein